MAGDDKQDQPDQDDHEPVGQQVDGERLDHEEDAQDDQYHGKLLATPRPQGDHRNPTSRTAGSAAGGAARPSAPIAASVRGSKTWVASLTGAIHTCSPTGGRTEGSVRARKAAVPSR